MQPNTIIRDPATIQALPDMPSRGAWNDFVFWLGRLISTIFTRYSQTAVGNTQKVALTFNDTMKSAVAWSTRFREHNNLQEAHKLLYSVAYDLTLHSKTEIDAIRQELTLGADSRDNEEILSTLKRAQTLAKLPSITDAIQNLVLGMEAKMRALLPPPAAVVVPPAVIADPVAAVPAEIPLEPNSPQAALDPEARRVARIMPTPANRRENKTDILPTLTSERLVLAEFHQILDIRPPGTPDFTAVEALGTLLDSKKPAQVAQKIGGLSIMSQLFLYEVTKTHEDLLLAAMAESYSVMKDSAVQTAQQQKDIIRAYVTIHRKDAVVGNRYKAFLAKLH